MTVIRCTQKLLEQIDADITSVINSDPLDEWYANLTVFHRHKIIVFLNAATRFVTLALKPTSRDLQNLPKLFATSLSSTLATEAVDESTITRLAQQLETAQLAKTTDRRVLGCLNDVIHHLKWHLSADEGNELDLAATKAVQSLNRLPWVNRTPTYAIDGMDAILRGHR
jgi:hypothetical protein